MVYDLVSVFMTTSGYVAVILNLALIPIIYLKSGKEIGSYKYLLLSYCLIAVIYAAIAVLLVPVRSTHLQKSLQVFEPSEKGWIFYATVQRIPIEPGSYLVAQFAGCYIMLLLVLEYSFTYRYFVMCSKYNLRWFKDPKLVFLIVCLYFIILGCTAGPVFVYMRQNTQLAEAFANDTTSDFQLDLYKISYIGAPMFDPNGGIVVKTALILLAWTITIISSCCVCAYCIYQIMKSFQKAVGMQEMSASARKLQTRLFFLLVFQTLAPVCFTFFPGLLSYVLGYLRIHAPIVSQGTTAILPIAQVVDPFLIFYMITDYRNFVAYLFKKYLLCQKVQYRVSSISNRSNDGPYTASANQQ